MKCDGEGCEKKALTGSKYCFGHKMRAAWCYKRQRGLDPGRDAQESWEEFKKKYKERNKY